MKKQTIKNNNVWLTVAPTVQQYCYWMGNVLHSSLTFPWLTVDFWSVDNDKSLHYNQVYGLPITEKKYKHHDSVAKKALKQ